MLTTSGSPLRQKAVSAYARARFSLDPTGGAVSSLGNDRNTWPLAISMMPRRRPPFSRAPNGLEVNPRLTPTVLILLCHIGATP